MRGALTLVNFLWKQTFRRAPHISICRIPTNPQSSLTLHVPSVRRFGAMATATTVSTLETHAFKDYHPEYNPLDFYRAHIAYALAGITGVDSSIIYQAVQRVQSLDNGDLVLAVPALRLKGEKPEVLGQKWATEVFLLLSALSQLASTY